MKPPVLLCYNLQGDRSQKIKGLAMRLKVRVRAVAPEEYAQPLAALCGMEPAAQTPAPAEPFTDEMLVLAHFTPELLNRFLYSFRSAGLPPVALKAMLTETNMRWDSATLHQQLAEEHEAMKNGQTPVHEPEGR